MSFLRRHMENAKFDDSHLPLNQRNLPPEWKIDSDYHDMLLYYQHTLLPLFFQAGVYDRNAPSASHVPIKTLRHYANHKFESIYVVSIEKESFDFLESSDIAKKDDPRSREYLLESVSNENIGASQARLTRELHDAGTRNHVLAHGASFKHAATQYFIQNMPDSGSRKRANREKTMISTGSRRNSLDWRKLWRSYTEASELPIG